MKTAAQTVAEKLAKLTPGPFVTLVKIQPIGALQVRMQVSGSRVFYWRYTYGGISERVLIGVYGSAIPPKTLTPTSDGYTLAAAIRAAEALATEHHHHRPQGGRPALQAKIKAQAEEAVEAKQLEQKYTLAALCRDYTDNLARLERRSHADANTIFKLHVIQAWPEIASLPARQVTPEQIADMMRRLIEDGKGRTSNKLRSYLRAAYALAATAKTDPAVPLKLKGYKVEANPAAITSVIQGANRPDKKPLSVVELRIYWNIIKDEPGIKGAALRLHLLTGGQRVEQLVKLKREDVVGDTITIYDLKGRPGSPPRAHVLPLLPEAKKALKDVMHDPEYALSTMPKTHVGATTLSNWAIDLVGDRIAYFKLKRVRSGVETALAAAGVSKDIRGRLQSHGQAGVQDRHYDGHEYLPEKKRALVTLQSILERKRNANVISIAA